MRIPLLPRWRLILLLFLVTSSARAQLSIEPVDLNVAALPSTPLPSLPDSSAVSPPPATHRFWDRENDWLFAGVGAGRGLDYASTLNMRRRGINEIFLTNSIVDNHPLFGGIEAAATAVSIGASYVFHRTGHHRLERWTSAVHFGVATAGAARNYALKTPHPQ